MYFFHSRQRPAGAVLLVFYMHVYLSLSPYQSPDFYSFAPFLPDCTGSEDNRGKRTYSPPLSNLKPLPFRSRYTLINPLRKNNCQLITHIPDYFTFFFFFFYQKIHSYFFLLWERSVFFFQVFAFCARCGKQAKQETGPAYIDGFPIFTAKKFKNNNNPR